MTRVFIGLIGLAIFAAGSLAGQQRAVGGEAGCCEQGCCENGGCPGCGGNGCGDRCPRCGCCMVPVCHMTCDIKERNGPQVRLHVQVDLPSARNAALLRLLLRSMRQRQ